jgi:hypothetical protein
MEQWYAKNYMFAMVFSQQVLVLATITEDALEMTFAHVNQVINFWILNVKHVQQEQINPILDQQCAWIVQQELGHQKDQQNVFYVQLVQNVKHQEL